MKLLKSLPLSLLFVSGFALSAPINIEGLSPEEAGLTIVKEAEARGEGFGNTSAKMTMTLINRKGEKSIRTLRSKVLEVPNSGDKSLSIFDDPKDVKGTALLTHAHGLKPDDQWLYLPAVKRVKRISSKNKSGPFMGSEFAFEDLGSQEVEKYDYKLLSEETYNGAETYKIQRIPKYENSGYTKQISWVEKEPLRILKVDFYDRKGELLKTLTSSDYEKFQDKYWRAKTLFMQNVQTKKATEINLSDFKFNDPSIKAKDFTSNALKRIR